MAAQQEAVVEQIASVLAAEDARNFQQPVIAGAVVSPDSVVRRLAVLGAGRIGDPRATPLVLPLLTDPDSTVRVAAAFALGLLRDPAGARPLMDRITGTPALDGPTAVEAITALAKIGGREVGAFFEGILAGSVVPTVEDRRPLVSQVVLESWRLGRDAPVVSLLPFLEDTSVGLRWRAAYTLGRLRAPAAGNRLSVALRDPEADRPCDGGPRAHSQLRGHRGPRLQGGGAAAGPSRRRRQRAGEDQRPSLAGRLRGLHARVRRSCRCSTTRSPMFRCRRRRPPASSAAPRPPGPSRGSRPPTVPSACGERRWSGSPGPTRPPSPSASARWRSSADWRERAAAAEGTAIAGPGRRPWFLSDRDPRVIAAGLQAWSAEVEGPDPVLVAAVRPLAQHADAAVRSVAADVLSRAAAPEDLTVLVASYRRAGRDSFPDAALAALGAIQAIGGSSAEARARVAEEFVSSAPRPDDYLLRRWAEENWPELAARWGRAAPIATGRSAQDYRDLVRRFIVAPDSVARPKVIIETDQRGPMEVELLGPEAPMTVANFLRLVDRRFFDGNRWHRVVPNFVVQDGDPRGDGFGGPGGAIRDEINRHRYDGPMLGMALSGPDTGSSQWFITLSPQPHLDGTYTIFGRVTGGLASLARITQGDVIRTIRMK